MALELTPKGMTPELKRSAKGTTKTEVFIVKGEEDPEVMLDAIPYEIGQEHVSIPNARLLNISVVPMPTGEDDYMEMTLEWGPAEKINSDQSQRNNNNEIWQYNQISQSRHIDAVEKVSEVAGKTWQIRYNAENPNGEPADTTAIGINGDNVAGVDVLRPSEALTVNKSYDLSEVNAAFRAALRLARGKLNTAAWVDWKKEEVLFVGATIRYDFGSSTASIDYSFICGQTSDLSYDILAEFPTVAAPTEALAIAGVPPFDYMWPIFPEKGTKIPKTAGDPRAGSVTVKYATAVYRSKLYLTTDFNVFNLVGPD